MQNDFLFPLRVFHGYLYEKRLKFRNKVRDKIRKHHLNKLRNKHLNEKCFIIGNGPSLKSKDLEKLKNVVTFASHRIYHIFPNTNWRPTYYCAQDQKLLEKSYAEIEHYISSPKFIAYINEKMLDLDINAHFIKLLDEPFFPNLPKFSSNIVEGVFEGFTVTYMCLQLAIFMGFKEIYLLGVDHEYSINMLNNGTIVTNDSIRDHFSDDDEITNIPQTYKSTLAYESAQDYATHNNIKIFNATRGGALDSFNRVDFDSLSFL